MGPAPGTRMFDLLTVPPQFLRIPQGHRILLFFISRDCPHCLVLAEKLETWRGLPGVGVAVFTRDEIEPDDPHWARLRGRAIPYFAEPEAFGALQIRSVPFTVLCDSSGAVISTRKGADLAEVTRMVQQPT